jgi:hypothetical protein
MTLIWSFRPVFIRHHRQKVKSMTKRESASDEENCGQTLCGLVKKITFGSHIF